MKKVLGFDFGMRRIGVAVGQTVTGTANPLTVLSARDGQPDWNQVEALLQKWQPDALLVGKPLHMDGQPHEITRAAEKFGNRLHGRFGYPVFFVDERLSSAEAEALMRDLPNNSESVQIDSMAASLIVETWLREQDKCNDRNE